MQMENPLTVFWQILSASGAKKVIINHGQTEHDCNQVEEVIISGQNNQNH